MFKRSIEFINYASPLVLIALALLALTKTVTRHEINAIIKYIKALDAREEKHFEELDAKLSELIKLKMKDRDQWNESLKALQRSR